MEGINGILHLSNTLRIHTVYWTYGRQLVILDYYMEPQHDATSSEIRFIYPWKPDTYGIRNNQNNQNNQNNPN